jgi:hypothetical protein
VKRNFERGRSGGRDSRKHGVKTLLRLRGGRLIFSDMQRTLPCPPLGAAGVDVKPVFNVVIAYEDFETGKQAKKTYDLLIENLGGDCQFNNQMWKFDVLALPKLREMAAKDALIADVIIVSCRGGSPLPDSVKRWVDLWQSEKSAAIALVALIDSPQEHVFQSREVRDYLAGIAKRGGMEFFGRPEEGGGRTESVPFIFDGGPKRGDRPLSTLADVFHRGTSFHHWGINE